MFEPYAIVIDDSQALAPAVQVYTDDDTDKDAALAALVSEYSQFPDNCDNGQTWEVKERDGDCTPWPWIVIHDTSAPKAITWVKFSVIDVWSTQLTRD